MKTSDLRGVGFAIAFAVALVLAAPPRAAAQTASQHYTEGMQNYEAGNLDRAKQNFRLALEVDKNFRAAATMLTKIDADEKQAGAQGLGVSAKTLEKVIVPVDFKDTTLEIAIETLRQRISERSDGKVEVNFVLKLPPELAKKRVTIHLDHTPATEVMRYLGGVAGVDFKIEQYAVMVVPAGAPTAAAPPGSSPVPVR